MLMAMLPLLTHDVHDRLLAAARAGATVLCSLDLQRTQSTVTAWHDGWTWNGHRYPYLARCQERTVYYWNGTEFEPAARFDRSFIKLVPTIWGPPTFEIDGIKMLPTAQISPYADAERKVSWIQPRDKVILDTCGGLGYFAACCLAGGARAVVSYEKNADVIWLRSLNPWSPSAATRLSLRHADVTQSIASHAPASFDAILHDPPRFGIAGELYSQSFYDKLARVLKRKGRLFHYTGQPNKLTSGRDVPVEVDKRLQKAGFATEIEGDGVLAFRR
jgi:predicted methyltransferase